VIKIFGREPAVWIGAIQVFLMLLLTIDPIGVDLLHLNDERVAVITMCLTLLTAAYAAWVLKHGVLAALVELVKGLGALLLAFNITVDADTMAQIIALISVIGSAYLRDRTSPLITPQFNNPLSAPVLPQSDTTRAA
jgi:uncharacterized membrane protein